VEGRDLSLAMPITQSPLTRLVILRCVLSTILAIPPNFGLHELIGDRQGVCSMTVTKNWRLTFRINAEGALIDMDLEDYHGS
jgi:proteic killer suppression protein